MTSFQAVGRIRRLFNLKKVGHCGTLDPFAEGVLPICLARATAAVQYMEVYDKVYTVTFRLGRKTDTQDVEGETVSIRTPVQEEIQSLLADDAAILRKVVDGLRGEQWQTPPIYSALKLDGRPLYSYARAGEAVDLSKKRRLITVFDARLLSAIHDPDGDLDAPVEVKARIHCSKGTYIRTLVHDLGESLSFGAYAYKLSRDASGPFDIESCVGFDELENTMPENEAYHPLLRSVDEALSYLPMVKLNEQDAKRFCHGQKIRRCEEQAGEAGRYRIMSPTGLIGVGYFQDSADGWPLLAAERVFVRPDES